MENKETKVGEKGAMLLSFSEKHLKTKGCLVVLVLSCKPGEQSINASSVDTGGSRNTIEAADSL